MPRGEVWGYLVHDACLTCWREPVGDTGSLPAGAPDVTWPRVPPLAHTGALGHTALCTGAHKDPSPRPVALGTALHCTALEP